MSAIGGGLTSSNLFESAAPSASNDNYVQRMMAHTAKSSSSSGEPSIDLDDVKAPAPLTTLSAAEATALSAGRHKVNTAQQGPQKYFSGASREKRRITKSDCLLWLETQRRSCKSALLYTAYCDQDRHNPVPSLRELELSTHELAQDRTEFTVPPILAKANGTGAADSGSKARIRNKENAAGGGGAAKSRKRQREEDGDGNGKPLGGSKNTLSELEGEEGLFEVISSTVVTQGTIAKNQKA